MNKKCLVMTTEKKYDITVIGSNYEISQVKAKKGEIITISVTPPAYRFPEVTSEQVSISLLETNKYSFVMPKVNVIININYVKSELHTINIIGSGDSGTLVPSKLSASWGDTVTVTATPAEYCTLTSIASDDVILNGSGNIRSFIMPNNPISISVIFNDPRPEPGMKKTILTNYYKGGCESICQDGCTEDCFYTMGYSSYGGSCNPNYGYIYNAGSSWSLAKYLKLPNNINYVYINGSKYKNRDSFRFSSNTGEQYTIWVMLK